MKTSEMRRIGRAALVYFALVFAAAFAMGVLRLLVLAPQIGAFAAVALEVPVILAVAWVIAGPVLRRWPLDRPQRLAMGALAFSLPLLTELALAKLVFGQTPRAFLAAMATPPGLPGLAGQLGFAAVPALRR